MEQAYAIETINLTRRYGRMVALDQLNLQVERGSIYGFIGPNGAGKTTTLRLLAGLLEPSSGEIRMLGQKLQPGGGQRMVGYMPDFFGVYDDLRVWEYLDFFARCYGLEAQQRKRTVDELLSLVDLSHKRDAYVQQLSRGMQQRLCLAHALVHNPPVLLLDEPASGLDPRARVELRELLRTLREMGKTILLSSHILSELAEICTEIGIIESGTLIVSGPVDTVRRQLQGGARLRIRLLRELERAQELLQQLAAHPTDGLPHPQLVRPDYSDSQALIVEFDSSDEEQQAALLSHLIAAGLVISEFRPQAENLEELFLRLTAEG
ncbi:ABC transporter ATP-binding protein [Candidatus Viridilinea mediisalina]|uniref:ABC transporter n=1 Tax=Candidatus Viridilinea mediisalina TaxID=2024553 RepID=A0A2A6RJL4_9CHLR|nr:ABC transporter ATP-binding protein [Candidatus Viridilinea mediisalina]PDW03058.1 ABC transporter [Candidatus Viridilinea mediisalina]